MRYVYTGRTDLRKGPKEARSGAPIIVGAGARGQSLYWGVWFYIFRRASNCSVARLSPATNRSPNTLKMSSGQEALFLPPRQAQPVLGGPEETVRFTSEDGTSKTPAAGLWLMTVPAGTVSLAASFT